MQALKKKLQATKKQGIKKISNNINLFQKKPPRKIDSGCVYPNCAQVLASLRLLDRKRKKKSRFLKRILLLKRGGAAGNAMQSDPKKTVFREGER